MYSFPIHMGRKFHPRKIGDTMTTSTSGHNLAQRAADERSRKVKELRYSLTLTGLLSIAFVLFLGLEVVLMTVTTRNVASLLSCTLGLLVMGIRLAMSIWETASKLAEYLVPRT